MHFDPHNVTGAPEADLGRHSALDLLFPGLDFVLAALKLHFGIDASYLVPFILFWSAAILAWSYVGEYVSDVVEPLVLSTAYIRPDDEVYNVLMSWISAQSFSVNSHRFFVNLDLNSQVWSPWGYDDDDDEDEDRGPESNSRDEPKIKSLAYTPAFGTHIFWYKRRPIFFTRKSNDRQSTLTMTTKRDEIKLSCLGRNPSILKDLLQVAHGDYLEKDNHKTIIYRGTGHPNQESFWQRCLAREPRPFNTIVMEDAAKKSIIDDVADFLSPETRSWYSNCGIPWRRGYLFSGPPGTGKSSLCFALAGLFKLRIYTVSLSSPASDEENLASLFSQLPKNCIVLLEDIDATGITDTRAAAPEVSRSETRSSKRRRSPKTRLSLSGLLNLLDGVASQEGRILIMTTNFVEHLDKALIRPGRVDMTIKFSLADANATRDIFKTVFDYMTKKNISSSKGGSSPATDTRMRPAQDDSFHIQDLAERFSSIIPSNEFSPAEIQGYLIQHKRDPEAAVAGASEWVQLARSEKVQSSASQNNSEGRNSAVASKAEEVPTEYEGSEGSESSSDEE